MRDKLELALWAAQVWDEVFVPALQHQGVTDLAVPTNIDICNWGKEYIVTHMTAVAKARASKLIDDAIGKAQDVAERYIA